MRYPEMSNYVYIKLVSKIWECIGTSKSSCRSQMLIDKEPLTQSSDADDKPDLDHCGEERALNLSTHRFAGPWTVLWPSLVGYGCRIPRFHVLPEESHLWQHCFDTTLYRKHWTKYEVKHWKWKNTIIHFA